jgi:hypothetical protein
MRFTRDETPDRGKRRWATFATVTDAFAHRRARS